MSENQTLKIGAAYIRVSTDDQTEYSPDSQVKLILDYAKAHDIIIPEEYVFRENEGVSGRKADRRPEFQRMVSMAKSTDHPFDVILVWKFSRFARNQEESIVYKSLLRKQCGVDVLSVSEPLIDGPFGSLIERIIEWMDEYYSIRLAGEVKRGMKEKVSRGGMVSIPSFGYDVKDGNYVINPDEARYVREISQWFMAGTGLLEIAKRLNALGVRTKRGNLWENRMIEYLLNNPVYNGKIRWNPEGITGKTADKDSLMIVQGSHEPIFNDEEWDALQNRMQEYKAANLKYARAVPTKLPDFMLRGIVKCSTCGHTLSRSTKDGMQCSGYIHGVCSVSHYVSITILNSLVLSYLETALTTDNFILIRKKTREKAKAIDTIARQISREKEKLARAKEAYLAGVDTLKEYERNKKSITSEINRLQKSTQDDIDIEKERKAFAKRHLITLEALRNPNIDESEKNAMLKSFVHQVTFNRDTCSVEMQFYI